MIAGRFIALEGGEGTGKSTQARLLVEALSDRGIKTVLTREPGGTPGAEAIRDLLLHPPGEGWGPRAEALLFAAARSDHVERRIRPALARGEWVISDRFVDSSRAYQGIAGGLGDEVVCALHGHGSEGIRPDLTVILTASDAPVSERLALRDGGVADAIGARDADYHARVNAAFLAFAAADRSRFAIVDGDGSPGEVHAQIMTVIAPLLSSEA